MRPPRHELGEEHPATLVALNGFAETLRAQGDLAGAQKLHERAVELRARVLGEEHPDTLTSLNNLVATLRDRGDLAGAQKLHERTLRTRRKRTGGGQASAASGPSL